MSTRLTAEQRQLIREALDKQKRAAMKLRGNAYDGNFVRKQHDTSGERRKRETRERWAEETIFELHDHLVKCNTCKKESYPSSPYKHFDDCPYFGRKTHA